MTVHRAGTGRRRRQDAAGAGPMYRSFRERANGCCHAETLGQASPGGAGRNRTLGIEALNAIEVPIAPPKAQRWFDTLQAKAAAARASGGEAGREMERLIPAMLSTIF